MSAFYNEIDKFAAEWLRKLSLSGQIRTGHVDDRSIRDLTPSDLESYDECHFFAGIGGWSLALRLAGWPPGRPVWTGSCPCQPFSSASRGRGDSFASAKDLWPCWYTFIEKRKPPLIFGEQVDTGKGLAWWDRTATDFERAGYTTRAASLCASLIGLPRRRRLFFAAYTDGQSKRDLRFDAEMARLSTTAKLARVDWRQLLDVDENRDGISNRMGSRRCYGNAIVPQLAATFVRAFLDSEDA